MTEIITSGPPELALEGRTSTTDRLAARSDLSPFVTKSPFRQADRIDGRTYPSGRGSWANLVTRGKVRTLTKTFPHDRGTTLMVQSEWTAEIYMLSLLPRLS